MDEEFGPRKFYKVGDIIAYKTSAHRYEVTFVGKRMVKATHRETGTVVKLYYPHELMDWTVIR